MTRSTHFAGWCHQNGVLMLVYDYMPNGSLDKHIFGGKDAPVLAGRSATTSSLASRRP